MPMLINTEFISTDKDIMCSVPCLKGHRIPVAKLLVDMAYTSLWEVANNYGLSEESMEGMLSDIVNLINGQENDSKTDAA